MIIQRLFAVLYMLAGLVKAFPELESVAETLKLAAIANQGTWYQGITFWLAEHGAAVNILVGVVLFGSGLVLMLNPLWATLVIYGQLLMMAIFVALLHHSQPQVIFLDALFALAAFYMLHVQYHRKPQPRTFPTRAFSTPVTLPVPPTSPPLEDEYDVVIIGGGVSGLTAATELTHKRVLVLEKSPTFGGNARYNTVSTLKFPIAGVCFQQPQPDSSMMRLLKKIGLEQAYKSNEKDTLVFFDTFLLLRCLGEVILGFLKYPAYLLKLSVWGLTGQLFLHAIIGKPYVVAAKQLGDPIFAELYTFLDKFSPRSKHYPSLPWTPDSAWSHEHMALLDNLSLHDYLFEPDKLGPLPEHLQPPRKLGKLVENAVATTLRVECLDIHDVSAYVGLHFLVGYLRGNLVTLPGGNGGISAGLYDYLSGHDTIRLQSHAQLQAITPQPNGTLIEVIVNGELNQVLARQVIWAAPKTELANWLPALPAEQLAALDQIRHEDYYLANVLLEKPLLSHSFGGYLIEPDAANEPYSWCKAGTCLVANWMDNQAGANVGVLTLLKPTTRSERQGRTAKNEFAALQQQTYVEIAKVLRNLGIPASMIEDIHIWYWPAGLVTSVVGQQAQGVFNLARQPFKNIHFANQDSVGIGNIESAVSAGLEAATAVKAALAQEFPPIDFAANLEMSS
ncbi:FAD-dependent oxidoreductase [Serratia plymuthica]|uniref:FAD-dependent oxidoreductase n=1 Tax=Serratia plymuthica TaxID=82996 RepID=UPI001F532D90|nr:FAD-dependent oxidoreductase [Serratia plymuthica]UNK26492.1 FAD-dependent oxidoreductase [Serratia plymuthica]